MQLGTASFSPDVSRPPPPGAGPVVANLTPQDVVHAVHAVIVALDLQGRVTFANAFAEEFFGYGAGELLGRSMAGTVMPATDAAGGDPATPGSGLCQHPERCVHYENEHLRRNGERVWLAWAKSPILDGEGKPAGILCVGFDITDRKKAEQSLREAQQLTQQVLRSAGEGIVIYDRRLRYVIWNPYMEEISGKPAATMLGRHPDEMFPFLREQGIVEMMERALAGEIINAPDIAVPAALTGQPRWTEARYAPLRDANQQIIGVIGTVRDITSRKDAEQELLATNRILRALSDVQTRVLREPHAPKRFSAMLQVLLELTESEYGFVGEVQRAADGRPFLKAHAITNIAWDAETRALFDKYSATGMEFHNLETLFGAVLSTGRSVISNDPANDPRRGGLPAGHPPLRSFMGLPFHLGEEFIGMAGVANRPGGYEEALADRLQPVLATCASLIDAQRNDRRRQQAEAALRESEERYRRLVETSPDAITVTDLQTRLLFCNTQFARMFGYERAEELLGRTGVELVADDDRPLIIEKLTKILDWKSIPAGEYRLIRKDGTLFHAEVHTSMIVGPHQEPIGLMVVARDITERRRVEEERRRLEQKMQQAQKLESLGVMAGGIAHDFNNLLTTILGYADLALCELPDPSPTRGHIEQVATGARRAAELTQQMLAYSGRSRFITHRLDLNQLVRGMIELLRVSITKNAVLHCSFADALDAIEADAAQLRQVVMNLILNASDALSQREGIIEVRTACCELDGSPLADCFTNEDPQAGRYVVLEVVDTGCGMTPQTKARIFDPFFTTKFTGRGLGLAAVLGIVKGHHGAIQVHSAPDRGTTFRILLPAAAQAAAPPLSAQAAAPTWRAPGAILVVDDEDSVRILAEQMLRNLAGNVMTASSGREALDVFSAHRGEISLILLDVTMPGLDGIETFAELQRIDPQVRVVLSSGYGEQGVAARLAGRSPAGFIAKPYRLSELQQVLQRVFEDAGGASSATS